MDSSTPPALPRATQRPFIRGIFNGLLLCSIGDIGVGLLQFILQKTNPGTQHGMLTAIAGLSTIGTVLFSTLLVLVASTYEKTPWRAFLPLLLIYAWGSVAFLPLPLYTGMSALTLISLNFQTLGVAFCIMQVRKTFGSRFLFPETAFFECRFSWRHCALAHGVLGAATVLMLCGSVVLGVFTLEKLTGGFLRIRPSGVYTETAVYLFKNSTLHLLPSVHVATPGFYEELVKHMPTEKAVLIPEGVTDHKNLTPNGIDHAVAAKSVGLTPQPHLEDLQKIDVHRCDADVSDFSKETQAVLRTFGDVTSALEKQNFSALLGVFLRETNVDLNILMKDVLEGRNARVVAAIEETAPKYQHIGVPWGAAHMVGIEKEMLARGAKKIGGERILVFAWKDLKPGTN